MKNVDFMGNGQFEGDVARRIQANGGRMDPGSMRPWVDSRGRSFITVFKGGDPKSPTSYQNVPIQTNGTLQRDEWKQLDQAVLGAARSRLGGIADLRANNLVMNLGNAMGTTVFEYHDINDAYLFPDSEVTWALEIG